MPVLSAELVFIEQMYKDPPHGVLVEVVKAILLS